MSKFIFLKRVDNSFFSFCLIYFLVFYFFSPSSLFADELVTISAQVGTVTNPVNPPQDAPGPVVIPQTAVRFTGYAYPYATVFLLKNGILVDQVIANNLGYFSITLKEQYSANILYTLFAKDTAGDKSLLLNYPLMIHDGFVTYLSGVRFPPTLKIDKTEVHPFDYLTIKGFALPGELLEVSVLDKDFNKKTYEFYSKIDGSYKLTFPLLNYIKGDYTILIRYKNDTRGSRLLKFKVTEVVKQLNDQNTYDIPGDCNFDRVIDIVDFSVLAFWYKKPKPPVCLDTNNDHIINLTDFSILAFYWTGRYE